MYLRLFTWWAILLGCLSLTACGSDDVEPVDTRIESKDTEVQLALSTSISVSEEATTRMSRVNTQADGQFRGMEYLHFIPFRSSSLIQKSDQALAPFIKFFTMRYYSDPVLTKNPDDRVNLPYYKYTVSKSLFNAYSVPEGTHSFLVYGHPEGGGVNDTPENKFAMGSLVTTGLDVEEGDLKAEDITFAPDPIYQGSSKDVYDKAHTAAQEIAEYLTYVAHASYKDADENEVPWYKVTATTDANAAAMFQQLIHKGLIFTMSDVRLTSQMKTIINGDYGSLTTLKTNIGKRAKPTVGSPFYGKIGYQSNNFVIYSDSPWYNFPDTGHLPKGMFVFKWIEPEEGDGDPYFAVLDNENTTLNNLTNIYTTIDPRVAGPDLLAYPAQLWYYNNSTIHTRDTKLTEEEITGKIICSNPWSSTGFDNVFPLTSTSVGEETQAVVVDKKTDYGVALLMANAYLSASSISQNGISIGGDVIQFKGLMISHQHKAGFDFQPIDNGFYMLYDNNLLNSRINEYTNGSPGKPITLTVNTPDRNYASILALPSYPEEKVYLIAEFVVLSSKLNKVFTNDNCEIYPDTPFYMIARLDPTASGLTKPEDVESQVFISDRKTLVKLKVSSLNNAYNYVPDVRTPNLKIGLEVEFDWVQADPWTGWME